MKTKSLLKLALITALIGTFLVIILANNLEPSITKISAINERMIDEWIKIQGEVVDEMITNNLQILTIKDESASIRCVLREKTNSSFQNHDVMILGKVSEYKKELEIEISKIELKK